MQVKCEQWGLTGIEWTKRKLQFQTKQHMYIHWTSLCFFLRSANAAHNNGIWSTGLVGLMWLFLLMFVAGSAWSQNWRYNQVSAHKRKKRKKANMGYLLSSWDCWLREGLASSVWDLSLKIVSTVVQRATLTANHSHSLLFSLLGRDFNAIKLASTLKCNNETHIKTRLHMHFYFKELPPDIVYRNFSRWEVTLIGLLSHKLLKEVKHLYLSNTFHFGWIPMSSREWVPHTGQRKWQVCYVFVLNW